MDLPSNGFKERFKTSKGGAMRYTEKSSVKPRGKEKRHEDRYTSSLSIFREQKPGKQAVKPKAADCAVPGLRPRSSENVKSRDCRPRSEESHGTRSETQRRFVSFLKTSLSIEWKSGSRGSSSEGDTETSTIGNGSQPQPTSACTKKSASINELERAYEAVRLTVPRIEGRPAQKDSEKTRAVSVRVQRTRGHRTIRNKTLSGGNQQQLNIRRFKANSNLSKRLPMIEERPFSDPRMASGMRALPRSCFRVKSQKPSGHRSVTITNIGNNNADNSCSSCGLVGTSSVVVQGKQKLHPFTIHTMAPQERPNKGIRDWGTTSNQTGLTRRKRVKGRHFWLVTGMSAWLNNNCGAICICCIWSVLSVFCQLPFEDNGKSTNKLSVLRT